MSGREVAEVAARAARWLEAENGTGDLQDVMQVVVKSLEEVDEVLDALDARDWPAAVEECADVVITTRVALHAMGQIGCDVALVLANFTVPVASLARIDQVGNELSRAAIRLGKPVGGWKRQNPRKRQQGLVVSPDVVADQLDEVALAAGRLIITLGWPIDDALRAGARKIHGRLDEAGVPR